MCGRGSFVCLGAFSNAATWGGGELSKEEGGGALSPSLSLLRGREGGRNNPSPAQECMTRMTSRSCISPSPPRSPSLDGRRKDP